MPGMFPAIGRLLGSAGRSIRATTGPLISLALPFYSISFAKEGCGVASMIFIGHSGADGAIHLGAATLANAVCNITGYAVAYGFNTSLDTLMSRLHGSKKFAEAGVYAEAALLCMTAAVLPMGLVWWHSSLVLHHVLRLPVAPALMAQTWTRIILAGLWPTLVSDVLRRWLQVRVAISVRMHFVAL